MGTRQPGRRSEAEVTATGAMTLPFDLKDFARFLYLSLFQSRGTNYRLTPRRIGWLALFCLMYPMLEIVTWAGLLLDEILFPRYRSQAIRRPVFIVGNPRSGTTFLYHLLSRDEQFTCMRTWEVFFAPSITMRKAFKVVAAVDRLLGSPLQRLLAWGEARSRKRIHMHELGLHVPEEDEYLNLHIWSTVLIWQFTGLLEEARSLTFFDDALDEGEKRRIMGHYRRCLQRHLYAHGGRRGETACHLAKSPSSSPKIDAFYATFTEPRFIYLVRHPAEVVASFTSSLEHGWNLFGDPVEAYGGREYVLEMAEYWYKHPLERFERAPAGSYVVVRFDDLVSDPAEAVAGIYEALGLEISAAFAEVLREETEKAGTYRSSHRYSLEEMGLSREEIAGRFRVVYERFRFDAG